MLNMELVYKLTDWTVSFLESIYGEMNVYLVLGLSRSSGPQGSRRRVTSTAVKILERLL